MSLYDFANGDPVNGFDPDGRLATKFWNIVQGVGDVTADNMDGGYPEYSQSDIKIGADIADYGWAGAYLHIPILNSGISTLEMWDGNTVTGQPMNGWDYVGGTLNSVGSGLGVYGFTTSFIRNSADQMLNSSLDDLRISSVDGNATFQPNSVTTRQAIAVDFYGQTGWSDTRIDNHLQGVDFTKPVEVVTLPKGTQTVQYQLPGAPTGNYFAPVGTPANQLGIYTGGRTGATFSAGTDTSVLKSTANSININWEVNGWNIEAQGGGTQYFSPNPASFNSR